MFDCIIMNPPYSRNLHLKILSEAVKHGKTIVNLSPVRWLKDPLAEIKKNSDYNKFEESVSKHIVDLECISSRDATELFGGEKAVQIAEELGIYTLDSQGGYDYTPKDEFWNGIYEKKSIPNLTTYSEVMDGNFVCLVAFTGCLKRNQPAKSCLNNYGPFINGKNKFGQTYEEAKNANPRFTIGKIFDQPVVAFDTGAEAVNFWKTCNTKVWQFICMKSTNANEVRLNYLPWLFDAINPRTREIGYNSEWTDEDLCTYFGFTDENYEEILDTLGGKTTTITHINWYEDFDVAQEFEEWESRQYGSKTVEVRRKYGAFFTPPKLSCRMVDRLGVQKGDTLLDPTVGAGGLLAASILMGRVNPEDCYGIDLDPSNVEVARERLGYLGVPEENIIVGDALRGESYYFEEFM